MKLLRLRLRIITFGAQLNGLGSLPKPDRAIKINYDFAALLAFCKLGEAVTFPAGSMKEYVDSLKKLAKDHGMPGDVFENSVQFADTVGAVIMTWSKGDNYLQTRGAPEYTVMDSPGRWVPTPPAYSSAAEPHWNQIRPMVLDSANQFIPPPPYKFDITNKKSDYYKEVMLIKNAGYS